MNLYPSIEAAPAQHLIEAEEPDFFIRAGCEERWLGTYESRDDEDDRLERIAICGCSQGAGLSAYCWWMVIERRTGCLHTVSVTAENQPARRWLMRDSCGLPRVRAAFGRRRLYGFLLDDEVKGRKQGRQDKGNASQALLSDCLHIVFLRDMVRRARDMIARIGENLPFLICNCEIYRPARAQR